MEQQGFDIRALIGETEKRVVSKMMELGYTMNTVENSPFYANQTLLFWAMFDTQIILTIGENNCLAVTVAQVEFQEIKKWIEDNTVIIPDAQLNTAPPPGVSTEVREDENFWYSIRKKDSIYNVTITRR